MVLTLYSPNPVPLPGSFVVKNGSKIWSWTVWLDPASGIGDPQPDAASEKWSRGQRQRPSALFHGLHGIGNEIDQNVKDLVRVAPRGGALLIFFPHADIVKTDRIPGDFQCLVKPVVQANHRIIATRGLSGILRQIPADGACSADGFDDFLRLLVDGFQVGFLNKVFGQPHDQLERIVDVVRNAGGKRADPRQFFRVKELGLKIRFMTDQFPQEASGRSAQDLSLWAFVDLENRSISGSPVTSMIKLTPWLYTRSSTRSAMAIWRFFARKSPGAAGSRSEIPTISIEGIKMEEIKERGSSSPGPEDRDFGLRELRATALSVRGCTA